MSELTTIFWSCLIIANIWMAKEGFGWRSLVFICFIGVVLIALMVTQNKG